MTVAELLVIAFLSGRVVKITEFAKEIGCHREAVRDALTVLMSERLITCKRVGKALHYSAMSNTGLAAWTPKLNAKIERRTVPDFVSLCEVFGIRLVNIDLPATRHVLEGSWAS